MNRPWTKNKYKASLQCDTFMDNKCKLQNLGTEWQTKHEIYITRLPLITCQRPDFFLVMYPRNKANFFQVFCSSQ